MEFTTMEQVRKLLDKCFKGTVFHVLHTNYLILKVEYFNEEGKEIHEKLYINKTDGDLLYHHVDKVNVKDLTSMKGKRINWEKLDYDDVKDIFNLTHCYR